MSNDNVKVGTSIPKKDYEKVQEIIKEDGYMNMSEFFREAIRDKIRNIKAIKEQKYF